MILEKQLDEIVVAFVESKDGKLELYFRADDLPSVNVPPGKAVRVTIDYVALAHLENRAE